MDNDTASALFTGEVCLSWAQGYGTNYPVCGGVWRRLGGGGVGVSPVLRVLAGWDEDSIKAELQKKKLP